MGSYCSVQRGKVIHAWSRGLSPWHAQSVRKGDAWTGKPSTVLDAEALRLSGLWACEEAPVSTEFDQVLSQVDTVERTPLTADELARSSKLFPLHTAEIFWFHVKHYFMLAAQALLVFCYVVGPY